MNDFLNSFPIEEAVVFRKCIELHPSAVQLQRSLLKLVSLCRRFRACSTGDLTLLLLPEHASRRSFKRMDIFIMVRPKGSGKAAALLTFSFPVLITNMLPRLFLAWRGLYSVKNCVCH